MTGAEFKWWFRGFTDALEGEDIDPDQWERILEQVNKIDDDKVSTETLRARAEAVRQAYAKHRFGYNPFAP